jgi:FkbM family methyltransferase
MRRNAAHLDVWADRSGEDHSRFCCVAGGIQFTNRGRIYTMPNGLIARYHLLESIDKLRRLAEYVRPDDLAIVDVGAHAGLFTAFALERAPGAHAVVIEPEVMMEPVIRRNLAPFTAWRLVQVAVSDVNGEATFYRASSSQESSLIASSIRSAAVPVAVDRDARRSVRGHRAHRCP